MSGRILVTGATGKTGRNLVGLLRERGVPYRTASRGGETPFDWTDATTWAPALDGVEAAYLVAPPTVDDPYGKLVAFGETALRHGVRRLVFLGMAGLPAGGPAHGQVHQWLIDHAPEWAVLSPSAFMENFTEGGHLATIRGEDAIYSATGKGRVAFIGAHDIARAALAALTAPAPINADVVITGGETLSFDAVAAIIGEACGRRIAHVDITPEQLVGRFRQRGIPDATAWFLAAGYRTIAEGFQDYVTDDFERLVGAPPTPFTAFAAANADVWRR